MLVTRNKQPSLWDAALPEICRRLPAELERVDAYLDDDRFFKYRYRLGYETLCAEVADSISWRRFARIDIDARVPHPTT